MTTDQMMSLYGDNVVLLEEYYKLFKEDPSSLTKDWVLFSKNWKGHPFRVMDLVGMGLTGTDM